MDGLEEVIVSAIPDLTRDKMFSSSILCGPDSRFYVGAPLRTRNGINIGVVCALDKEPRLYLEPELRQFMRDMAVTIMGYLESKRSSADHGRGRRMIRGIGSFVEGKAGMASWERSDDSGLFRISAGSEGALNENQQGILRREEREEARNRRLQLQREIQPSTPPSVTSDSLQVNQAMIQAIENVEQNAPLLDFMAIPVEDVSGATLGLPGSAHARVVFSKAANIIRESIGVEGVIFLDAHISSFGGLNTLENSRSSQSSNSSSDDSESVKSMSTIQDNEGAPDCPILGFSTTKLSSIDGEKAASYRAKVPEKLLAKLLRRYPQGRIFYVEEHGIAVSSESSEDDATDVKNSRPGSHTAPRPKPQRRFSAIEEHSLLTDLLPEARCIALVPVWDVSTGKWYAGGLAYSNQRSRIFTTEHELSYLRAFAMVAMSEVVRVDTMTSEKAKTDLLSSLSHELRSPLHGIVLGAELMSDTHLDVFQSNVLHTIETCGRTLLGT